jgi:hypothetical protein
MNVPLVKREDLSTLALSILRIKSYLQNLSETRGLPDPRVSPHPFKAIF